MQEIAEQGTERMQARQAELAEKDRRIQQVLVDHDLDALLISRNENIAWATAGVVDMRVGVQRETAAGSLLVTREGAKYYLTTENEADRFATEEFAGLEYEPLLQPWYANAVDESIRKAVGGGKVAGDVPLGTGAALSLQPYRFELTDAEVERYRQLGRAVAEATTSVVLAIQQGMSEVEMQAMLAGELISKNILPSVYLCAVDDRIRNYRHAVPRAGVLNRFGMVGLCARRWGLTISMTRFVHFGRMPGDLQEGFGITAHVYASLLAATRQGVTSAELFARAGQAYAAAGHMGAETLHHQGGATGYNEREWVARPAGAERVGAQQAFAWNPSFRGAKIEDTVIYRDKRIEVLTQTPALPATTASAEGYTCQVAGVLER